jgi:hypothetical protein
MGYLRVEREAGVIDHLGMDEDETVLELPRVGHRRVRDRRTDATRLKGAEYVAAPFYGAGNEPVGGRGDWSSPHHLIDIGVVVGGYVDELPTVQVANFFTSHHCDFPFWLAVRYIHKRPSNGLTAW